MMLFMQRARNAVCTTFLKARRYAETCFYGIIRYFPKLSQFRRINIFQADEHMRVIRFLVRWSLQKCKRCRKQEVCA